MPLQARHSPFLSPPESSVFYILYIVLIVTIPREQESSEQPATKAPGAANTQQASLLVPCYIHKEMHSEKLG